MWKYDITKKPDFYKKIFLPSEINYCLKYKNPYPHFAGKFAIKEAVQKSIQEPISALNIEISSRDSKPFVKIKGLKRKKYRFQVSISHAKKIAVGVVIAEKI